MFNQLLISIFGLMTVICYPTINHTGTGYELATFSEVTSEPNYAILVEYPKLKGVAKESVEAAVNQFIKKEAVEQVRTFIKDIRASYQLDKILFTQQKSTLKVSAKMGLVNQKIASFALIAVHRNAAIDHPQYYCKTYTFDLQTAKLLTLEELFKRKDYLSILSTYAFKEIIEQRKKEGIIPNNNKIEIATKSKVSNFRNFVLQPKYFQLYFDANKISSRQEPNVEISIPYDQLEKCLNKYQIF